MVSCPTVFSKDLAGCVGHYFVEGVGQQVHVGIFVIQYDKGCKFPTSQCFECFCYIRILKFLGVKFDSCWLWFADPLQANVEGCHQQVMITSDICSWKASCPGNVHSCVKAPFHQDVVDLIVMFSIWAVPGPSSRCFVWAKCASAHCTLQIRGPLSFVSALQKGPQVSC